MFVLIIGGRFGGKYKDSDKSITNSEYQEASRMKIPVFVLVESAVLAEYHVYNENLKLTGKDAADAIKYPSSDNVKIFEFIDEVRKNSINNAIVPFKDFSDIETYLKKQWAGMMFTYLVQEIEENKISDTLSALTQMSEKIEMLSKQILNSVGSEKAIITTKLYEKAISYDVFRDLSFIGVKPTPRDILLYMSFEDISKAFGIKITYKKDEVKPSNFLSSGGSMGWDRFIQSSEDYVKLRADLAKILSENGFTIETFLEEEKNPNGSH